MPAQNKEKNREQRENGMPKTKNSRLREIRFVVQKYKIGFVSTNQILHVIYVAKIILLQLIFIIVNLQQKLNLLAGWQIVDMGKNKFLKR